MKTEISIIMSVYNEPIEWLEKSIESILNQTFKNFEFIIVLDNPENKKNEELIIQYQKIDNRIIFIKNKKNIGLAKSLNKALNIARGKYIARMDADDISLKDRLQLQYDFVEKNKDIAICGSSVYKMDEKGEIYGVMNPPFFIESDLNKIEQILFSRRTVAFHPTWLVRKSVYEKLKGYRSFKVAQDYDFLLRAVDYGYKIANIDKPLLKYRINSKNLSSTKSIYQYKSMLYAQKLHNQRKKFGINEFSKDEYEKFLRTSKFMEKIHSFSTKMFVKSMNLRSKKNKLYLLYLLLSCVSPYQIRRLFVLIINKK